MFELLVVLVGLIVLVCIIIDCVVVSVRQREPYPLFRGLVLPVLCIGLAMGIISLLLPFGGRHPGAARRMYCSNHLKQIALALHNYHDTYKRFPPAVTYDEDGRAMHSWRVLILPYLEQQALYEAYDMSEPWNGPSNSKLVAQMPPVFRCPSVPKADVESRTNYVAISSGGRADGKLRLQTAWSDDAPRSFRDLIDGSSNIILVVESSSDPVVWTEPRDLRYETLPIAINHETGVGLSSHHPGGCQVALADGSVRFVAETIPAETLRKLLLCNDGEPVGDY